MGIVGEPEPARGHRGVEAVEHRPGPVVQAEGVTVVGAKDVDGPGVGEPEQRGGASCHVARWVSRHAVRVYPNHSPPYRSGWTCSAVAIRAATPPRGDASCSRSPAATISLVIFVVVSEFGEERPPRPLL